MRRIRRTENAPRVEMTAMIDVVFLLLVFFIYSMVMMIRADVLPVRLTTIATGKQAKPEAVEAITIDKNGALFLNRKPIQFTELDAALAALAGAPNHAKLYVAMEAQSNSDRGPLLINLIERIRAAGIDDFAIVGQHQEGKAPEPASLR
ncbi:MAG: biopolymer transporter ExbD [Planctomycetes bacterium]|nr:biopolymer transporter ExbD [Planctomycetota bacterium]